MAHGLLIDVTPNIYAIGVVAGMVTAGLALGIVLEQVLRWFGIDFQSRPR